MKSTRSYRLTRLVGLAALVVCFSAALASAQEASGTFTLPFEARWGQAVLPPGDYSFTLKFRETWGMAIVRGNSRAVIVMAEAGTTDYKDPDHSSLILVRSGGNYRIRALQLAPLGLTFTYPVPKTERQFVAQAPELLERIPVMGASGK